MTDYKAKISLDAQSLVEGSRTFNQLGGQVRMVEGLLRGDLVGAVSQAGEAIRTLMATMKAMPLASGVAAIGAAIVAAVKIYDEQMTKALERAKAAAAQFKRAREGLYEKPLTADEQARKNVENLLSAGDGMGIVPLKERIAVAERDERGLVDAARTMAGIFGPGSAEHGQALQQLAQTRIVLRIYKDGLAEAYAQQKAANQKRLDEQAAAHAAEVAAAKKAATEKAAAQDKAEKDAAAALKSALETRRQSTLTEEQKLAELQQAIRYRMSAVWGIPDKAKRMAYEAETVQMATQADRLSSSIRSRRSRGRAADAPAADKAVAPGSLMSAALDQARSGPSYRGASDDDVWDNFYAGRRGGDIIRMRGSMDSAFARSRAELRSRRAGLGRSAQDVVDVKTGEEQSVEDRGAHRYLKTIAKAVDGGFT